MKNVIAIIPARAGSKRIPNKNIVEFMGKPMIAWTIRAALESNIFSDVLVSTDCEEIALLSRTFGASVPFLRDPKDADDFAPIGIATSNALLQMENYKSVKYDTVIQLMPNCPCRTADDIIASYNSFLVSGTSFQISVFQLGWMNPWWAVELDKKTMRPKPLFFSIVVKL
jgi:N-acylneuraminate cytidylyltransferase